VPKSFKWIASIFFVIGLGMLGGGLYAISSTVSFIQKAATGRGVVVSLERSRSSDSVSYYPVVKFTTREGQEFRFRSNVGSSPPSHRTGEAVTVLYNPANPHDAKIDSFFSLWGFGLIFGAMGLVFALAGGGMIVIPRRNAARRQQIRRHGMPVQTQFQSVEKNTGLQVNGRNPWRITSQWQNPSTGEVHVFHSENLWYDPTPYVQAKEITVYLDRKNQKDYAMDVSFLPKMAE